MRKKEKIQLIIIGVIVVVTVLFLWLRDRGGEEEERIWIARPESGTKKQAVSFTVEETEEEWTFHVEPRAKTEAEMEAAFSETLQRLNELFGTKDGESLVITESIFLPQYLSDIGVDIRWESSDATVLSKDGTVHREQLEERCEVTLRAYISVGEETREHWFLIEVLPYEEGSREALLYEAEQTLTELERKTEGEEGFYLPEEIGEVTVGLPEKKLSMAGLLAAGVLLLPVALFLAKRQEKEKERKRRGDELLAAYPRLITKLTLYTGAGLSLRGAWERLAAEYRTVAERTGEKDALAEEVLVLAGELKNGTSEAKAYEAFGRRISLKPYLRCASLLVSQLQKGSGNMREGLEHEVQLAWELQRERAAKKGEEAQTKLLFPMMGMLFLVMGVVMIPAFFSM